jgi:non-ribosomal peptide synthetase component F
LRALGAQLAELRRYSFYQGGESELPRFVSTVEIESAPTNGKLHEHGATLDVRELQTVAQRKSPLTLIAPSPAEATLRLSYNPAAFDEAAAARLRQHFENLLTGILQQPQLPLSQLSILSPSELEQLLYAFNETRAPLPSTSIHALFQEQVLRSPVAVALSFLDSSLTYLELARCHV